MRVDPDRPDYREGPLFRTVIMIAIVTAAIALTLITG
jgi:hypothetical protein